MVQALAGSIRNKEKQETNREVDIRGEGYGTINGYFYTSEKYAPGLATVVQLNSY